MKRPFLVTCAAASLAVLSFTSLSSCDESTFRALLNANNLESLFNLYQGCPDLQSQYEAAVQSEGDLITIDELKEGMANNTVGFSMALLLNKNGINKLFKKASDMTKYSYDTGVAKFTLKVPTIKLDGCPRDMLTKLLTDLQGDSFYTSQIKERNEISCITMELPISISVPIVGSSEFSASVGLPVYGKIKGDDPDNEEDYAKGLRTSIFADLKHAQLIDLNLGGLNSTVTNLIESGINIAWQQFVSKDFRNVAMFDIAAWNVGDGEIKMIAGAPIVNSESKTLQLGMYSNIVSARNSRTAIDYEFPDEADIGLNIHPDLIRGLLARMMREKHITSEMKLEQGDYAVTLPDVADEYPESELLKLDWYNNNPNDWGKYFSVAFRIWNNGTICGWMDLIAGLYAEIDTNGKFEIGMGNIHAGKAYGGMQLIDSAINAVTQTDFFKGILDYTKISFNFNEIGVSDSKNDETGSNMSKTEMGALNFRINGNGISLFLNFMDL